MIFPSLHIGGFFVPDRAFIFDVWPGFRNNKINIKGGTHDVNII